MKSWPRPSPKNQTPRTQKNETARAGRTVRRNSSPRPIATWMRAKKVFQTATWGPTKLPTLVMIHRTMSGWLLALFKR